jgi:sec-independent protein translocase protein TatA
MRALEPWHIILLVVVLLVLFGSKRLPDAARGIGRSLRIFKSEVKDLTTDDEATERPNPPAPPAQTAQQLPAAAPAPAQPVVSPVTVERDGATVPRE